MINLKDVLRARKLTIGSWITLGHTSIPEIMRRAGYEWLTVDMEHSAITLSEMQTLIQVIELSQVTPLVRVGNNDPSLIKRVMDAGSHGVIVPMVNSKDDAVKAVSAVKYPPMGTRGIGLARAQGYGLEFEQYKRRINKDSIVIVQIEDIRAVDNLEEILGTDGVDGSIIGPYDLSASLGHAGDFEKPDMKQALKLYEDVCRRMKKPMGAHIVEPDPKIVLNYICKGYTFLAVGFDALYLGRKCREVMAAVRQASKKRPA